MRAAPVLVVAALLAACSDGGEKDAAPTATPASRPSTVELVPGRCPFDPPETDHWECSTMIVPADRGAPDGAHVLIPVAVLRSQATDRLPDPIVYFNGGPGDETLQGFAQFWAEFAAGGRRDVILFDQRGTGGATPSLDCPEHEAALRENLATPTDARGDTDRENAAMRACKSRLVDAGVDLDDFDTPTTVADADDLRRALGVEQWNVIGISYGTTVALEVARQHPDTVRSMVIDSVFPPDITHAGTAVLRAAARAFNTFFDGCATSSACAADHPDLHAEFNALAADWDAQPFETDVVDPADPDGPKLRVRLDGQDLVSGLHQALYDTGLIPALPAASAQIRKRDDGARALVATFVASALEQGARTAEGIGSVVNCADRQHVDADDGGADVDALVAETPSLAAFLPTGVDDCVLWDVASVPAAFNTVPRSKVHTLALAGEYDPITPPADTERTAARFAGSTYVLFPGLGHGELVAHDCPRSIVKAFIDDPTRAPDLACVASMGPPDFARG